MRDETTKRTDPRVQQKSQKGDTDKQIVVKHGDEEEPYEEEQTDGSTAGEVLDVAWFAGVITKLDKNWKDRWNHLEAEVEQIKAAKYEGLLKDALQQTNTTSEPKCNGPWRNQTVHGQRRIEGKGTDYTSEPEDRELSPKATRD